MMVVTSSEWYQPMIIKVLLLLLLLLLLSSSTPPTMAVTNVNYETIINVRVCEFIFLTKLSTQETFCVCDQEPQGALPVCGRKMEQKEHVTIVFFSIVHHFFCFLVCIFHD
jgi:hypothetical protein